MELKRPASMNELVYYTKRNLDNCKAEVWVFKEKCPKCKEGIMQKPKMRAKEYVCDKCGHSTDAEEYEDTLTANISYTCHLCGDVGDKQQPFKRKSVKVFDKSKNKDVAAKAVQVICDKCGGKINVTKKLK